jgi:hypothetical protein
VNTTTQERSKSFAGRNVVRALVLAATLAIPAQGAHAQEAIGVPFVGKNHLSFYTTELSRDGIGQARTAIFGGTYGRRFGAGQGPVRLGMLLRAGARPLDEHDGILDAGATLTATASMPGAERLTMTASAGVGAVLWGQASPETGEPDTGRRSVKVPLGAGAAYSLRAGRATISPFAMITGSYSREDDYVNDESVARESGWRLGSAAGVSVGFREMVLSLTDLRNERGLPNDHRVIFSVGISW